MNNTGNAPNQIHTMKRDDAANLTEDDFYRSLEEYAQSKVLGVAVKVTLDLFGRVVEEEMARIEREVGAEKFKRGMYREACKIFTRQCTATTLDDFLTLDAYNKIVIHHPKAPSRL
ncbi:hypothetical protein MRB53_016175 [Persea americana]|uniref:Uncharacterized protein n=1 Tax=Persea americana TaxID=3435 RepID=A0ACC2M1J4_PERAE|nr:hypothetical protein MRB53_016175 [Persea americana]